MMVTCTPALANMLPYSMPITPAPITSSVRGKRGACRMVSLVNTHSGSVSVPPGMIARLPVAMSTWRADTLRVPSAPSTAI